MPSFLAIVIIIIRSGTRNPAEKNTEFNPRYKPKAKVVKALKSLNFFAAGNRSLRAIVTE